VEVNPLLVEPGTLVVALGVVEPHQYAGYSGGAKTVVIGCGGPRTIGATHGPTYLDQPGTRLGRIEGNPFQRFVRQAGAMTGLRWAVNVGLDAEYRIGDEASGPPAEVHDRLVARARQIYETPVAAPYDVVIAGVGAPKDVNLYQASRGVTYIGLGGRPVIRSGGVMILPAPIPEGAGEGQGERNFLDVLRRSDDLDAMMREMRAHGCKPGEQRAFMVAQLLAHYRVIVVGASDEAVVRAAHFTPARTMDEALALAQDWCGSSMPRGLLVEHALQTIPVPA
jgi:nickel-dependent lactate racemase